MIKLMTIEELVERIPTRVDVTDFCGHYSDSGFMIRKIGTEQLYAEAIDRLPCDNEYEETNIKQIDYGRDDN